MIHFIQRVLNRLKVHFLGSRLVLDAVNLPRILHVYQELCSVLNVEQCAAINGRFTWLPNSGILEGLPLDICYYRITEVMGIELAAPKRLVVDVSSSLPNLRSYFISDLEYRAYLDKKQAVLDQLRVRKIPVVEICPEVDDLSPYMLRKRIGALLGLVL